MSAQSSEVMMSLLKELALLKDLDEMSKSRAESELEVSEFEQRQNRRREITDQIKALADPVGDQ